MQTQTIYKILLRQLQIVRQFQILNKNKVILFSKLQFFNNTPYNLLIFINIIKSDGGIWE